MSLVAVVLILLVWAVYGIARAIKPSDPYIDDINEHCKSVMQRSNIKERKKYIRQDAARRRNKNG